ncbi:MAG: universal stress protein [Gammaproteobacteria bacterium]|nr:universal stress protein [Gammaproteobacteria bacterium]
MKLLVGIDLAESTEKVVKKAEEIANALSAKVWILHVAKPEPADFYIGGHEPDSVGFEMDPQSFRDSLAKRFHDEHRQIQEIADRLRKAGLDATALLVQGAAVDAMLEEASKLDVDMIVVGSYGRGAMYQLLVGSVSEGLLHRAECPILVVPTHERT